VTGRSGIMRTLLRLDARSVSTRRRRSVDGTVCRFGWQVADGVALDMGAFKATRIRCCWGDSPVRNLSDGSDPPAGPCELPIH